MTTGRLRNDLVKHSPFANLNFLFQKFEIQPNTNLSTEHCKSPQQLSFGGQKKT